MDNAAHSRRNFLQRVNVGFDTAFFLIAAIASLWLVWLVFDDTRRHFWAWFLFLVLLWVTLAYLFLPRLHRLFTYVYVPNYFIGRSRTPDGLLGDPVNLAFNGPEENIHRLMQAAGWTLADPVNLRSSLRIIESTLTRKSYDQAPVSTLNLFGRMQDFAYQQEVDGSPSKRHHVRFWRCPKAWPLPGGSREVEWMAAASFDRAVGLSLFTLQVTHKISSDIDGERDHVVATLKAVDPDLRVDVLPDFSTAYHSVNGGGDEVQTDGDLPIISAVSVPDTLPEPDATAIHEDAGRPDARSNDEQTQLNKIPRPLVVYLSAVLVGLQVIASLFWIADLHHHWKNTLFASIEGFALGSLRTPLSNETRVYVIILVVVAIMALRVGLALGMYFGYNWARTWLMGISTLSIVGAFYEWVRVDMDFPLDTALLPTAVSILLLLALSASSMSDYTVARQDWRLKRRHLKQIAKRPQSG